VAAAALDLADSQGLIVRGYGTLHAARFLLGAVEDAAAARAWLATLAGRLDDARERPSELALNVAFTHPGLRRLGLSDSTLQGFPPQFVEGMTEEHRARLLGDVAESAPHGWDWGAPAGEPIDLLLLVYATDTTAVEQAVDALRGELATAGIRLVRELDTAETQPREHFGFRDGVSQPRIAGLGDASGPNAIAAGEFVLGYPNEYGLQPDGPGDFGRNGTFLVMRQLRQDVHGFWDWCERASAGADGSVDAAARVRLAAKLIGRWPSGAPLVLAPDADDPSLAEANDFAYHDADRAGLRCPIGAHVRRSNPRDSLDPSPGSQASIDVGKRHRLLRRGRQYGSFVPVEELLSAGASETWNDEPRGLHFICLATNLARQFEFVQHTWLNNPRFAGLYDNPDPLVAAEPERGRMFVVPAEPVRERYTGLPRFVTVRGGAYFFLPGIRAVRALAAA
jgi:Dyp-type peroxidase family